MFRNAPLILKIVPKLAKQEKSTNESKGQPEQ
jgi:hypothetical protein